MPFTYMEGIELIPRFSHYTIDEESESNITKNQSFPQVQYQNPVLGVYFDWKSFLTLISVAIVISFGIYKVGTLP